MSITISELLLLSNMISNEENPDTVSTISATDKELGEEPNLVLCRLIGSGYVSVDKSYDYRITPKGEAKFYEQYALLEWFNR